MADYTVIRTSAKENRSDCILEFAVPGAGTNDASLQWQTIVAEVRSFDGLAGSTINPRKVSDGPHIAALDAGQIIEVAFSVEYDANLSNAEKATALDAAATAKQAEYSADFTALYEFYGLERTV